MAKHPTGAENQVLTACLQDGTRARQTFSGWEWEQVALVHNVPGNGDERLFNACQAKGIPELGQPHGTYEDTAILVERIPEPVLNSRTIRVRLIYRPIGVWRVSGSVSGHDHEVNMDAAGEPMIVEYTDQNGKTWQQIASVRDESSRLNLVFEATLPGTPALDAVRYHNKVNADVWEAGEPGHWRCAAITWDPDLNTGQFRDPRIMLYSPVYCVHRYEFQYAPEGWLAQAAYIDSQTNRVPANVESLAGPPNKPESVNGRARFQVKRAISFQETFKFLPPVIRGIA